MNDIVGPYDELGNGTAVRNGVVRGWLDGVMVFEKTDAVLRRHPSIKIDEVWLNHVHGGTIVAETSHPFAMAALVVARKYIGPLQVGDVAVPPPVVPPVVDKDLPAWLKGKPTHQWIAIPQTKLSESDIAPQIAAGLASASASNIGYGNARKGIMDFSGAALKRAGSDLFLFGGGGAGAWAGNDVRGLRLADDAPTWRTAVRPSPRSAVWPRNVLGAHPYMQDGKPNARHSYWSPHFIDGQGRLVVFGCQSVWEADGAQYDVVDSAEMAAGTWNPAGSHPSIPSRQGWNGRWACKNAKTEDVYVSANMGIHRWSPISNSWTPAYVSTTSSGFDRGYAAIDHVNGRLLRIGFWEGSPATPIMLDLASGKLTAGTLSGFDVSLADGRWATGLVFDPVLGKFLLFKDDGFLYSISYVSDAEWLLARMEITGVSPPVGASSGYSAGAAIWGRMQYVPELAGVVIAQAYDQPVYFVRTS
jgi:hypothetical protein